MQPIHLIDESKKHEKYCILPFNAIQITPFQITPCCKLQYMQPVDGEWGNAINKYLNNPKLRALQNDFLTGQVKNPCNRCFTSAGALYPGAKLEEFAGLVNESGTNPIIYDTTLQLLNVQLNSTCNLQCRHCTPQSSSSLTKIWDADFVAVTGISKTPSMSNDDALVDELISNPAFNNVQSVLLSGGEPLMNIKLKDLVIAFQKRGVKKIGIVTNAATDPFGFFHFFDSLDSVRKTVTVSVDGDRTIHAYYRHQLNIDEFEKNCALLKESKTIKKMVLMSVSALNIFNIPSAMNYCYALFDDDFYFNISIVENTYLNIAVLPISDREQLLAFYNNAIENFEFSHKRNGALLKQHLEKIKAYIVRSLTRPHNVQNFKNFINFIKLTDRRYNTSIDAVCPTLASIITSYENLHASGYDMTQQTHG